MLCYVMLCYVMLCYVMLCYVMLCVLCYVMLCYVMLCKNVNQILSNPSNYTVWGRNTQFGGGGETIRNETTITKHMGAKRLGEMV